MANELLKERRAQEIIIATKTSSRGDCQVAWIQGRKNFKATSTNNKAAAAENLAVKYFLGSAWRAQLAEKELKKVQVEPLGEGKFIGRYAA